MGQTKDRADLSGQIVDGRYRLEKLVGRGGMADVYRATHLLLESTVAIKVLITELAVQEDGKRRFVREAKRSFRLDDNHCVRVSDFGVTDSGVLYIVQEYLDGRTVARELAIDGPVESVRAASILAQTASALAHAHEIGLIHRDLKTDNIMLIQRGSNPDYVKVLDFGLAKLWDEDGGGLSMLQSSASLTRDGMTFGTPAYMSPEQARGLDLTPATDVFSFGTVGYEIVTGTLPFNAVGVVQILTKIIQEAPAPPSSLCPGLDPELEAVVLHCLEKDHGDRPSSARDIAARLTEIHGRLVASASASAQRSLPSPAETVAMDDSPSVHDGVGVAPAAPSAGALSPQPGSAARTKAPAATTRSGQVQNRPLLVLVLMLVAIAVAAAALWLFGGSGEPRARAEPAMGPPAAAAAPPPKVARIPSTRIAAPTDAEAAPPPRRGESLTGKSASPSSRGRPRRPRRAGDGKSSEGIENPRQIADARRLVAEARAASSLLGRLAKADAARRLDPKNRDAQLVYGVALIDSGEKERGCLHLRRAGALPEAIETRRTSGCSD